MAIKVTGKVVARGVVRIFSVTTVADPSTWDALSVNWDQVDTTWDELA